MKMQDLSKAEAVTITLTGLELFALLWKAVKGGADLNLEGRKAYTLAAHKIESQLREQGFM